MQAMLHSRKIAQNISMFKSHNMERNSIKVYKTPTGFRLYQDYKIAWYGSLLNQVDYTARSGALKGQSTRGWWTERVYGSVLQFLQKEYTGNSPSTKQIVDKVVSKPELNKTFIKSIPKG